MTEERWEPAPSAVCSQVAGLEATRGGGGTAELPAKLRQKLLVKHGPSSGLAPKLGPPLPLSAKEHSAAIREPTAKEAGDPFPTPSMPRKGMGASVPGKPPARSSPKPVPKAALKPASKPAPMPTPKPTWTPAPRPASKAASKPAPRPAPKPALKPTSRRPGGAVEAAPLTRPLRDIPRVDYRETEGSESEGVSKEGCLSPEAGLRTEASGSPGANAFPGGPGPVRFPEASKKPRGAALLRRIQELEADVVTERHEKERALAAEEAAKAAALAGKAVVKKAVETAAAAAEAVIEDIPKKVEQARCLTSAAAALQSANARVAKLEDVAADLRLKLSGVEDRNAALSRQVESLEAAVARSMSQVCAITIRSLFRQNYGFVHDSDSSNPKPSQSSAKHSRLARYCKLQRTLILVNQLHHHFLFQPLLLLSCFGAEIRY